MFYFRKNDLFIVKMWFSLLYFTLPYFTLVVPFASFIINSFDFRYSTSSSSTIFFFLLFIHRLIFSTYSSIIISVWGFSYWIFYESTTKLSKNNFLVTMFTMRMAFHLYSLLALIHFNIYHGVRVLCTKNISFLYDVTRVKS